MVKEYLLTLDDQDLNIISTALLEMPYKLSAPVIGKIGAQLSAADQPRVEEPSSKSAE